MFFRGKLRSDEYDSMPRYLQLPQSNSVGWLMLFQIGSMGITSVDV